MKNLFAAVRKTSKLSLCLDIQSKRHISSKLPSTFKIERFLGKYEYNTRYLLSCSDAEALTIPDLISIADEDTKVITTLLLNVYRN